MPNNEEQDLAMLIALDPPKNKNIKMVIDPNQANYNYQ